MNKHDDGIYTPRREPVRMIGMSRLEWLLLAIAILIIVIGSSHYLN